MLAWEGVWEIQEDPEDDGHQCCTSVMDINARGCPGTVPDMGNCKQHHSRNKHDFLPNATSSDPLCREGET